MARFSPRHATHALTAGAFVDLIALPLAGFFRPILTPVIWLARLPGLVGGILLAVLVVWRLVGSARRRVGGSRWLGGDLAANFRSRHYSWNHSEVICLSRQRSFSFGADIYRLPGPYGHRCDCFFASIRVLWAMLGDKYLFHFRGPEFGCGVDGAA